MQICIDSEFTIRENDIKQHIINDKRTPFMNKCKHFLNTGLPKKVAILSPDFFTNNFTYSEKIFPFTIFSDNPSSVLCEEIIAWIKKNWSPFATYKEHVQNKRYSIIVDSIKMATILQKKIDPQFITVENNIPFISRIHHLEDITKKLYSPFPEIWEENIVLFKKLTQIEPKLASGEKTTKLDEKQTSPKTIELKLEQQYPLKSELESYILKNLKNVDLGFVVSTTPEYVKNFGLTMIQNFENGANKKIFLLVRTFLDSKNLEKKITIYNEKTHITTYHHFTTYFVNFNDDEQFPILKIYNNLEFELIHYNIANNHVFGMITLNFAINEYLRLDPKTVSTNYRGAREQFIASLFLNTDIVEFSKDIEYITRFSIIGIYQDPKLLLAGDIKV